MTAYASDVPRSHSDQNLTTQVRGISLASSDHPPVSWGAIIAGGVLATALFVLLLSLAAGIGLAIISPWSSAQTMATTAGLGAAIALIVAHLIVFSIGGYVVGRLSQRETVEADVEELRFRDGAHGLMVWAIGYLLSLYVASMAVAGVAGGVASIGSSLVSGGAQVVSGAALSTASDSGQSEQSSALGNPIDYYVDQILRNPRADTAPQPDGELRAEFTRIMGRALAAGELAPDDRSYLAQRVAARTGQPPADVERRIDETVTQARASIEATAEAARNAANTARQAGAFASFWTFMSFLLGAVAAVVAAVIGGNHRRTRTPSHSVSAS